LASAVTKKTGRPAHRPPKDIDEERVRGYAQVGCTNEEIGSLLGVSADTIERRFRPALTAGRAELRMSLRRSQVKKAMEGSDTMLIWLGKQLLAQKNEPQPVTVDAASQAALVKAHLDAMDARTLGGSD
jgi:hypothetical protein